MHAVLHIRLRDFRDARDRVRRVMVEVANRKMRQGALASGRQRAAEALQEAREGAGGWLAR